MIVDKLKLQKIKEIAFFLQLSLKIVRLALESKSKPLNNYFVQLCMKRLNSGLAIYPIKKRLIQPTRISEIIP